VLMTLGYIVDLLPNQNRSSKKGFPVLSHSASMFYDEDHDEEEDDEMALSLGFLNRLSHHHRRRHHHHRYCHHHHLADVLATLRSVIELGCNRARVIRLFI